MHKTTDCTLYLLYLFILFCYLNILPFKTHHRSPIDIIFCSSVPLLQRRFHVEEKLLVVLLGYTTIQSSAPLRLIPLVENECVGKPGPVGLFLCVCACVSVCVCDPFHLPVHVNRKPTEIRHDAFPTLPKCNSVQNNTHHASKNAKNV